MGNKGLVLMSKQGEGRKLRSHIIEFNEKKGKMQHNLRSF